ncbi:MAG: phage shock protein A [Gammaproteobacteria bacterium]|nr:phage shock protein A [Gammaproteobacteria bacterium]RPG24931.1 MAG: PspA/IM30 family protein [Gammaproteobacteria bacterium TMED50]
MSILKKIVSAVRGGASELGELIVDSNGTRIFEQEIRDADNYVRKAKHDLTDVMAKQMQASRQVESTRQEIRQHESYAVKALEQNDEKLALEVADKVATLESDLEEQEAVLTAFTDHVTRLKTLVKKTERQLADYERQLSMVKTTESVQKASASISDNYASTSSRILSAKDSLERIKKRQQETYDRIGAAESLEKEEQGDLDEKLAAAGITATPKSAQDVLDRIKRGQT